MKKSFQTVCKKKSDKYPECFDIGEKYFVEMKFYSNAITLYWVTDSKGRYTSFDQMNFDMCFYSEDEMVCVNRANLIDKMTNE